MFVFHAVDRKMKDIDRFESKYVICENGCWEWVGARSSRYGSFYFPNYPKKFSKSMVSAHKSSLFLYKNIVPKLKEDVLHSCDNGFCVNPQHLSIGSHKENMEDMVNKGRSKPSRKVVSDEDAYIIKMHREAGFSVRYIHKFVCPTISESQVSRISRGLTC